jgi:hypothetical protein
VTAGTRSPLRLAKRHSGDRGRSGPSVRPVPTQHAIVLARNRPASKPGALSQSPTSRRAGTERATTASALAAAPVSLCLCHGRERQRRPMLTIASTIHATRAGGSPPTDRARPEPESRRRAASVVSGARLSRIAQLGSTRLRRRADTPRAYVEPVDRRTSARFCLSSVASVSDGRIRRSAAFATPVSSSAGSRLHACRPALPPRHWPERRPVAGR